MARLLYFDCFSGASGDMILGALVDAGLRIDGLREVVASLRLDGVTLATERVDRNGFGATKFRVRTDAGVAPPGRAHHHSGYASLRSLIPLREPRLDAPGGLLAVVRVQPVTSTRPPHRKVSKRVSK